ncbi:formate dehydrogenase accessory sulfurtransferase FdhD [Zeaxanthinibacter enoshimensis]|uniref:Sulfur carrier protein FdhD n=1 Tax=Zeaxanthinibacter enoshimensis TaxID=392009 RepID=A0A4R6TKY0_9FLAO|nr:formate dehydrogenase accessory sulfurtransferase FdhD [Zeaxanthinibacter enoshimensis]TDQ31634.1 FdhD protein [Zeaxanthinibacter enoshimensis]
MKQADPHKSILKAGIFRFRDQKLEAVEDALAVEDPLEIGIMIPGQIPPVPAQTISLTMRTPGNDRELAAGYLFTEGIIRQRDEIIQVLDLPALVTLVLKPDQERDLSVLERRSVTSSSCGVCGKLSASAIRREPAYRENASFEPIESSVLQELPENLRAAQHNFERTGGLHAAALFDAEGNLQLLREDVGRHNALDKLLGAALMAGMLPLSHQVLLLSGRTSFELVQKAAMGGIRMVVSVGAPSSKALQLAREYDITLAGFLKSNGFNIYHGENRIKFD